MFAGCDEMRNDLLRPSPEGRRIPALGWRAPVKQGLFLVAHKGAHFFQLEKN
jgi:hypothetical protein